MVHDQIDLGPGYTSSAYYKLYDQSEQYISSSSWDIGFVTSLMSASVISNAQTVSVYKAPDADSSDYATLNTTDYLTWPVVYNSDETWYTGALNKGADGSNPFDFGWGIYDLSTHEVYGDSLFVIEKGSDIYKFWIRKKTATGDYVIRYKNVTTGASDVDITIPAAAYSSKNFVYLNLENPATLDIEPATTDWDILFTNYIAEIPYFGPYPVTGALSNINIPASEARGVDTAVADISNYPPLSTNISEIGYDWKYFDYINFEYIIEDSLTYFVQGQSGDYYSIVFTGFDFMTGIITFDLTATTMNVGIHDAEGELSAAAVYPNPASGSFNIIYEGKENMLTEVRLMDVDGREVLSTSFRTQAGFNTQRLALPDLSNGMYHLLLQTGNQVLNLKVMVLQ